MPFLSRTPELSRAEASSVSDVIASALDGSSGIAVIRREYINAVTASKGLQRSGNDMNVEAGRLAGCKYILLGSVTRLSSGSHEKGKSSTIFVNHRPFHTTFNAVKVSRYQTADIEARLIDTATGRVVLSFTCSGSILKKDKEDASGLRMSAVGAAASGVADKVRGFIAGEYPEVISAGRNKVVINRGISSGISSGVLYKIYQDAGEVFDLNGQSLGRHAVNISLVRVTEAESETCTAEVLANLGVIRSGDKAEVISEADAGNLKLISSRH